jgi:hypothetical protein
VTNREALEEAEGCEEAGTGRARRNPAIFRERLVAGTSLEEFCRFNIELRGRPRNEKAMGKNEMTEIYHIGMYHMSMMSLPDLQQ